MSVDDMFGSSHSLTVSGNVSHTTFGAFCIKILYLTHEAERPSSRATLA